MDPNPSPFSSFTVGKYSLIILCCWDHTMFWLYPATLRFSFGHRLENDWEGTESTHWVHPRKRKPRFVQRQKRRCFANSIPFSPHARMQLMQSILQLKMSFIWFHAHWILELCLAHHRSTVWAILPSVAAFFLQTPVCIWWETVLKTSLCSYIVRTALSLKLLADKNMFTSTYQSTEGKQQPLEGN